MAATNSEEVDFPRGGASVLTPLEHRQIAIKAANDLFKASEKRKDDHTTDEPAAKKRRKSDKKKPAVNKKDDKAEKAAPINRLSLKDLTPETLMTGCITKIKDLELIVALPSQITGVVPITEISEPITAAVERVANGGDDDDESDDSDDEEEEQGLPNLRDLFRVGQFVQCRVVRVEGADQASSRDKKKKFQVELTLRPEAINRDVAKVDAAEGSVLTASVVSAEDHGYILSLGIEGVTAFCKLKDAEEYVNQYNRGEALVPGQIVQCAVSKSAKDDQRTINVTLNPSKVVKAVTKSPASSIDSIVPGLLVNGVVKDTQRKGLNVTFMGLYDATIEASQVPGGNIAAYSVGNNVTFRIMFCDQKAIGGSLLPHMLADAKTQTQQYIGARYPHGTLLENVKVERVVRGKGLYLSIQGVEGITAFASVSNLSDDRIENLSEESQAFGVDTTHRARVLNYNPIEDVLSVTLKKSVLDEKYGNINELAVGDVVEGTVHKFIRAGLLLSVSSGIMALVPPMHYADAALQHPELKYKPGTAVRGLVLERDVDNSRMLVSLKQSLIDSPLPRITSWETAKPEMITHGVIQSVRPAGAIVRFFGGMTAFVPASQMTETRVDNLASAFRSGQTVKAYIYDVNEAQRRMIASLTNVGKLKKEEKQARKKEQEDKYAPGKIVPVTIKSVKETQLNIELENGRHGRIAVTELFTDISQIKDLKRPLKQFKAGAKLEAKILGLRNTKGHGYLPITRTHDVKEVVDCSLKLGSKTDASGGRGKIGDKYLGFVTAVHKKHVDITAAAHLHGMIRKQFASSDPAKVANLEKLYAVGQVVPVELVAFNKQHRHAEFVPEQDKAIPRIHDIKSLSVGMVGLGVVQRLMRKQGLLVQIANNIHGRVHRTDLVDVFNKDPLAGFKEDQIVRYTVVAVNPKKKQIDLSLRSCRSDVGANPPNADREINTIADIEAGQVLNGYVSNVANSGVFVSVGRSVTARVKIGYLSDDFVKDWKKLYSVGQLVKCKILHVDAENNQVEGALNASQVDGKKKAAAKDEDGDDIMAELSSSDEESEDDNDNDNGSDDDDDDDNDDNDEAMQDVRDIDDEMAEAASDSDSDNDDDDAPVPALGSKGFDWTGQTVDTKDDSESESEEEESDDEDAAKNKKKAAANKEVEDKTAELSSTAPQSAADYERLIVGSPNSSFVWINYMAYQLQLSEIDKAREIGERALTSISFREEQEKMNVWVAMLNLENTYGNEETLEEVFKRSCVYCDPEKMHIRLAEIYERSEKMEKVKDLMEQALKKFSQNPKFWIQYGLFCLKQGDVESSRELLQRCVKVLPKHHHVDTISKFAQMEFKHGEPERGRTVFEGLLSSYPKRIDIWNVYVDMEIKAGDQEIIRRLFERLTSMKVSSKKMKFFFKKWLQYEKEHGSEEDAERVKEKALEYVNSSDRA